MTPSQPGRAGDGRIGRRAAVARGAAATLAAARALAPGVFVGCSLGVPRQGEVTLGQCLHLTALAGLHREYRLKLPSGRDLDTVEVSCAAADAAELLRDAAFRAVAHRPAYRPY